MSKETDMVGKVRRVAYAGMAVNVAVAALKGIAGVAFASQALMADAVHSLSDLLTDVSVVLGVRYWTAPADEKHPYGHGKIEALVTLFIALALVAVSYGLGSHAVRSFLAGGTSSPGLPALFCALVSIFITRVAWEIACPALQELIDANIGDKASVVAEIAQGVPGVLTVHKVRVRRYGGAFAADLHVHVDGSLSVAEGHAIGHAVSDALTDSGIGVTDAVVHVEPARY
jgi:divalent metal cation (Fe/Co/Zn/Cd) transporter